MITGESFEKYVNKVCDNIEVRFVTDDGDPYWRFLIPDPEGFTFYIRLANLYYDTLELKILHIDALEDVYEFLMLCGGLEKYIGLDDLYRYENIPEGVSDETVEYLYYLLTEEELFDQVLEFLATDFGEHIAYCECIFDDIKEDCDKFAELDSEE